MSRTTQRDSKMRINLKLCACFCLTPLVALSLGGCIEDCQGGGEVVCDETGFNCRHLVGGSCRVDLPGGVEPAPTPIFEYDIEPAPMLAAFAAIPGVDDSDGDGWITCNGTYWIDTGVWQGSCD